jgi:hypothetical protein
MSSFHQVYIGGYPNGGLINDRKPFLVPDNAFTTLENSYVWRNRVKKREGIKLVGRLQRTFSLINFFVTGAAPWTFNVLVRSGYVSSANNANPGQITTKSPHGLTTGDLVIITGVVGATGYNNTTFTITSTGTNTFTIGTSAAGFGVYVSGGFFISNRPWGTLQPNSSVTPGSFSITFGGNTYVDNGAGVITLSVAPFTVVGSINYATGAVTLTNTGAGGVATVLSFNYYSSLPVMGISRQDIFTEGIDNTIYFDEVYAYQFSGGDFQELSPGTTWSGNQTNFFWSTNYQASDASQLAFFTTNNNITLGASTPYDPIRYFFNSVWTDLQPILSDAATPIRLFQALILVPYYGRLLALNTWEGGTIETSRNFSARCRFSQLGDPTQIGSHGPPYVPGSWASDVFGKGGFIDAPTNESIVSAAFFRNTLIVSFEYSTWQLRYVGEYGLPFIWERISSDFGSNSTFSSVIFDKGVLQVSNRGITSASAGGLDRIDENIPETAFSMQISSPIANTNNQNFVHGIRDFEKELVYWNYIDSAKIAPQILTGSQPIFPNSVVMYNYRNDTWAIFRDNVTCFGIAQFSTGITWDSFTALWDSSISWDNQDAQTDTNYVVSGNQQGFIHLYEYGGDNPDLQGVYPTLLEYDPILAISSVDLTKTPIEITVIDHNLVDREVIYIVNMLWDGVDPGLNNKIYQVVVGKQPTGNKTLQLYYWDAQDQIYTPVQAVSNPPTYLGGGVLSLLPVINIVTKDFNPFQNKGLQYKLSYVDFLFNSSRENGITGFNINLFTNTRAGKNAQANVVVSNQDLLNSSASGIISEISLTNICIITSKNYSLPTGSVIYISGIVGTIELNSAYHTITVIDTDHFSLDDVNPTGFTPYISGGTWNLNNNPLIVSGSQYSDYRWYRFYATSFGQYLRLGVTYDNILMNQLCTHQTGFELHGMNFWFRPGGRITGP